MTIKKRLMQKQKSLLKSRLNFLSVYMHSKAGHKPPRAALPTALEPLAGELLPLYKELQRMAAADEDRYDGRIC